MDLQRIIGFVEKPILFFVGLMTTAMMVHVCADVLGKNLFDKPLPGTITIVSNYYMPVITFVPLVLAQHYGQHIVVDVVFNHFPRWLRTNATAVTFLLCAVIFAALAYTGWQEAVSKYKAGAFMTEYGIRFPTWPGYFMPAIGYGLIALYVVLQFIDFLAGGQSKTGAGSE